jgi:hypothetical protein
MRLPCPCGETERLDAILFGTSPIRFSAKRSAYSDMPSFSSQFPNLMHRGRAPAGVVDAVCCAVELQNGMVERNAGLPPEPRYTELSPTRFKGFDSEVTGTLLRCLRSKRLTDTARSSSQSFAW